MTLHAPKVCNTAMKRVAAFAVLLVVLAAPAWAGFDEGQAAYNRGDYATALRECRNASPDRGKHTINVTSRKDCSIRLLSALN